MAFHPPLSSSSRQPATRLLALLLGLAATLVALLADRELDTLALGERDEGLVALADDKDVRQTGGELAVERVTDRDNVVAAEVALAVNDGADTALVTAASEHDEVALLKLDVVDNLVLDEVKLDDVVDLDGRVRVADGAAVVGDDEGDALGTELDLADLEELVGRLLLRDAVDGKAALDVVQETEVLARLLDRDHVLEAGRVGLVGADLVVDLDEALLDDEGDLTAREGVLQAVADEDREREALALLVGARRGLGGVGATKLVEHPRLGRCQTAHVLLGTASHVDVRVICFEGERTSILFPFLEKYGPIAQFVSYGHHVVVLSDPALAKKAMRDITGKGFFHNPNPSVIELNTFNAQTGPDWQKRRNAFRRAFSTTCLRAHMGSISRITTAIADSLEGKCDSGEIFRIDDVFQCLTIEIISKMAFEMDVSAEKADHLRRALQSIFEERWVVLLPASWYLMRIPFGPFRRRKVAQDFWNSFKHEILDHIRSLDSKGAVPKDSLAESILQFSRLPGITEKEVIGEIGVFFLAGMDTTAHTMALAVYSLAANPSVQQRAQLEMDRQSALGSTDSHSIVPPYVEAVLKESMRKYPTASTGSFRQVTVDGGVELSPSLRLKKGSWVLFNIFALQNSVKIWGTDAGAFKPERFLADAAQVSGRHDDDPLDTGDAQLTVGGTSAAASALASNAAYAGVGHNPDEVAFAPFSYGIRNCIGMNLALLELRVGLAVLLSRFNFELGAPSMQDDRNMFETRFTSRPKDGLPIRVSRRVKY